MHIYDLALKPFKKGPMQAPVLTVKVTEKEGIIGDVRGHIHGKQVAIISYEQWQEACREARVIKPWWTRRVCVCVTGYSFSEQDVGKHVCFQHGVILYVTEETIPCSRMDAEAPGLQSALGNWRGGVRSNVVHGGVLTKDEKFVVI